MKVGYTMSNITIKDVALKAGVSVTSVSRVLNNRGYISENLKRKVMDAIEELDYTPNEIARSFYKNETKSIALIVPTIENPFFAELTFWIERELSKSGYHLFVGSSLNDSSNEKEYLKMLKEQRVDGIIVGSHNMGIEEYDKISGNIVSIERNISPKIPMIESNNYYGGKIATEELIKKGCKNVICITGNKSVNTPANNRAVAYTEVVSNYGLKEMIIEIPLTISEYDKKRRIKELFMSKIEFDGVFAGDDIIARYFMNIAKEFGVKVPEELKIIGFDGTKRMQDLVPQLSTVIQPIEEMAKKSVNILLKLINNEITDNIYTFPVTLKSSTTTSDNK